VKNYDKFYRKYGSNTVILPPPSDEVTEKEVALPNPSKVPMIPDLTEEELENLSDRFFMADEPESKEEVELRPTIPIGRKDTLVPLKNRDTILMNEDEDEADFMLPPSSSDSPDVPSIPPSPAPDVDKIQREHAKMVEEMESGQEEKEQTIDALLKNLDEGNFFDLASDQSSANKLLKICSKFYDLCCKF